MTCSAIHMVPVCFSMDNKTTWLWLEKDHINGIKKPPLTV